VNVKRLTRTRSVLVMGLVLALVATACGGDDKGGGGTAQGADSPSPQPTGTPLVIGWVGTESNGATGAASTQGADAMDTWVQWTNDHGGLGGHPVKAVYEDDKGDPAVGTAAVKKLIENDHVIAIVGSSSGQTQQTWADYVKDKKVPVISGNLIDTLWFSNPMFYGVGGTVIANIWGQMKSASVDGHKKVAVVLCTEVAACAQAQPLFKANAEKVGMELTNNILASATATSYTAECVQAKDGGATALAAFVDQVTMIRDCDRQGFKPALINADMAPTQTMIEQTPALGDNTVGSAEQWACLDPSVPGAGDLYTALKKYHKNWAPDGSDFKDFASPICTAWAGGVAFAKAIENAAIPATQEATSADVIRGLSMFKDEELGGIAPAVTFSDGTKPNPMNNCVFLYKWKEGKFSAVPDAGGKPYTCQPPA
jgi:branched-chain amino acid transport system substrate-binding protein